MPRRPKASNPPCPHCSDRHTVRNGFTRENRQRWRCWACRRTFGPTTGTLAARRWTTPLWSRLRTPPDEVARTLLVVVERGTLAAAAEQTSHRYETIGRWLQAIAHPTATHYAQRLTEALAQELHLSASEIDAFWRFVRSWRPRAGRVVTTTWSARSPGRDTASQGGEDGRLEGPPASRSMPISIRKRGVATPTPECYNPRENGGKT
jgi:hypothetical protein